MGAVFALVDRLGVDTGFSPVIVLLTATHFHFAGFGLLALACLLAASRPWLRAPVVGLIVGIPLTALGFVLSSDPINAIGACIVGSSGIGVGIALVTARVIERAGWLSCAAGVALLVGMPMGIAWALRTRAQGRGRGPWSPAAGVPDDPVEDPGRHRPAVLGGGPDIVDRPDLRRHRLGRGVSHLDGGPRAFEQ